jgi:hypothetical protein
MPVSKTRVFQFFVDARLPIAPILVDGIIAGRGSLEQLWDTKDGAIGGWMIQTRMGAVEEKGWKRRCRG